MLHSLKTASISVYYVVFCVGSTLVSSFKCFRHDPATLFPTVLAISVNLTHYIVVFYFPESVLLIFLHFSKVDFIDYTDLQ